MITIFKYLNPLFHTGYMIHHPAEVLEIFRPNDKDIRSADEDTLATVKMWDDNILTLVVEQKISTDINVGDKVLVDYRPVSIPTSANIPMIAKQTITKILKGKRAEIVWKEYKKFFEQQRQRPQTTVQRPAESYIG